VRIEHVLVDEVTSSTLELLTPHTAYQGYGNLIHQSKSAVFMCSCQAPLASIDYLTKQNKTWGRAEEQMRTVLLTNLCQAECSDSKHDATLLQIIISPTLTEDFPKTPHRRTFLLRKNDFLRVAKNKPGAYKVFRA
jgi:hypothetical protein